MTATTLPQGAQLLSDNKILEIGMRHFRKGHDPKAEANFIAAVREILGTGLTAVDDAGCCSACAGSGEQQHMTSHLGPDDYEVTGPCDQCGGTGAAPPAEIDTGDAVAVVEPIGDCQTEAMLLKPLPAGSLLYASANAVGAFQSRVQPWLLECFGEMIAGDREERNHRFIEEALELVQACGCTASEAHQLVDYVFARPVGEKVQEVGGVMVTLAALCLAQGLDMAAAGETELARIWTKVEPIRAKQAAKPKHSPLPVAPAHCGYCDDTGDVHGLDGEWRGVCSCAAGDRVRAAVASPDDSPLETGEGDAR